MEFYHFFANNTGENKDIKGIIQKVRSYGLKRNDPKISRLLPETKGSIFLIGDFALKVNQYCPYVAVSLDDMLADGFEVYEANNSVAANVYHLLLSREDVKMSDIEDQNLKKRYGVRRITKLDDLTRVTVEFKPIMDGGDIIVDVKCKPFKPELLVKNDIPLKYIRGFFNCGE